MACLTPDVCPKHRLGLSVKPAAAEGGANMEKSYEALNVEPALLAGYGGVPIVNLILLRLITKSRLEGTFDNQVVDLYNSVKKLKSLQLW